MVNPHDIDGLKERMLQAMRAGDRELARRMKPMREVVRSRTSRAGQPGSSRRCQGATDPVRWCWITGPTRRTTSSCGMLAIGSTFAT